MRKRILVVEDDEDIGSLLLNVLRDEQRDVFLARNIEAAEAMSGSGDMDVIVLDIALHAVSRGCDSSNGIFANRSAGPR